MINLNTLQKVQSHHHFLQINNRETHIVFRYYSPQKQQQQPYSPIQTEQSAIQSELANVLGLAKSTHDPRAISDKFYEKNQKEIKYSMLDAYEKFESNLLKKRNQYEKRQSGTRVNKIKLCTNNKRVQTDRKNRNFSKNKREINNMRNTKSTKNIHGIKNIQIDLINTKKRKRNLSIDVDKIEEQHENKMKKKSMQQLSDVPRKISIHLKQNNMQKKTDLQNYVTPQRSNKQNRSKSKSRRKGISVCSSISSRKNKSLSLKKNEDSTTPFRKNNTSPLKSIANKRVIHLGSRKSHLTHSQTHRQLNFGRNSLNIQ